MTCSTTIQLLVLADAAEPASEFFKINASAIIAVASAVVTTYFWFVKANRERAGLRILQSGPFESWHKPSLSHLPREEQEKHPNKSEARWTGDLFVANASTLPNAVIGVQVAVKHQGQWLPGIFGWRDGGKPPWNLEPQSVTKRTVSAVVYVPDTVERKDLTQPHELLFTLLTADGKRYRKVITTHFQFTGKPQ